MDLRNRRADSLDRLRPGYPTVRDACTVSSIHCHLREKRAPLAGNTVYPTHAHARAAGHHYREPYLAPAYKREALQVLNYQAIVQDTVTRWRDAVSRPPPRNDTTGRLAQLNAAVNQLAQNGQWDDIRDLLFTSADFLHVLSLMLRNIHLAPSANRSESLEKHLLEARQHTDSAYNSLCAILRDDLSSVADASGSS